jgi:hypothetical protein
VSHVRIAPTFDHVEKAFDAVKYNEFSNEPVLDILVPSIDNLALAPEGKSVVAEVYPSLFRRRYPKDGRTGDEHDAFCVAAWLAEMDRRGTLDYYFKPPLSLPESRIARLEGWILGVC